MMRFRKGQKVFWKMIGACGIYASENARVSRIDEGGVWLSNGPGRKPSGPFSARTGRRLSMKGSMVQIISPLSTKAK